MLNPSDEEALRQCLEEGLITVAQADLVRQEAMSRAEGGEPMCMAMLLHGLGLIDQGRALQLLCEKDAVTQMVKSIGPYQVLKVLGVGGMGVVYQATTDAGEMVAVKLLQAGQQASPEVDRRFRREARLGMRIRSPHVVRVLNSGIDGQRHWLAMELVTGLSLRERLHQTGALPVTEAFMLLIQLVLAMGATTRLQILHRDIKPANIILAPARSGKDEPFCAKLCDFGLAKGWGGLGGSTRINITLAGLALGTPAYMSPEQAAGLPTLDQRTDIYGLGATMFHVLTGSAMFKGVDSLAIMKQHVHGSIDLTRLSANGVPPALAQLVGHMLEKHRAQRLGSWDEVLTCLRRMDPQLVAKVEAAAVDVMPAVRQRIGWRRLGLFTMFVVLAWVAWWSLTA